MENGHAPATKADIAELEHRLTERIVEITHASETRILRAFYNFATTLEKRMVLAEERDANILSRLVTLEGRVLQLEERLNIRPTH